MKELDPILHSQLRLAVGNLSVQLDKLSNAGYITVTKGFVGKKTRTTCQVTEQGRTAFVQYVESLKSYLNL